MKKYIVYFLEEFGGELSQQKTVLAESKEEARDKYLIENYSDKHKLIMVSSTAFFSTPQVFDNPIYQKNIKEATETDQNSIHYEDSPERRGAIENRNRSINIQSDKLDKLIELQEKQLHWIRFLGVVTLISLITAFVYILIAVLSGRPRY